jgi:hypothetical protein
LVALSPRLEHHVPAPFQLSLTPNGQSAAANAYIMQSTDHYRRNAPATAEVKPVNVSIDAVDDAPKLRR